MRTAQIGLGLLYVATKVALDDLSSAGVVRPLVVTPSNPSVGQPVALVSVGGLVVSGPHISTHVVATLGNALGAGLRAWRVMIGTTLRLLTLDWGLPSRDQSRRLTAAPSPSRRAAPAQ